MLRFAIALTVVYLVVRLAAVLWRRWHLAPTERAMKQAARNPAYMADVAERIGRKNEIKAPGNPSAEYIRDLVARLLDEEDEEMVFPRQQLEQIGAPAEPFLLAVLGDPQYRRESPDRHFIADSPYEQVVELLAAIGSAPLVEHLTPLIDSPDEDLRKLAALNLAHVANDAAIPIVTKALTHSDEDVRTYAIMGIGWALGSGHASPSFLRATFDLLTPIAAGETDTSPGDSVEYLLQIDRERATGLLRTDRFLRFENSELWLVLHALQKHRAPLSRERLWAILEHAKPLASAHPWEDIYGDCLLMLAESADERAMREIEQAMTSNVRHVRQDAAMAILRAHGMPSLDELTEAVWNREFASLSVPQRNLLVLREVHGEVNNGGYSQYFFNSSGDHWPVALEAARSVGANHVASQLERAVAVFGRKGPSLDIDKRRNEYGRLSDTTEKTLDDLSSEFYKDHDRLHGLLAKYVLAHRADFAGPAKTADGSRNDLE